MAGLMEKGAVVVLATMGVYAQHHPPRDADGGAEGPGRLPGPGFGIQVDVALALRVDSEVSQGGERCGDKALLAEEDVELGAAEEKGQVAAFRQPRVDAEAPQVGLELAPICLLAAPDEGAHLPCPVLEAKRAERGAQL